MNGREKYGKSQIRFAEAGILFVLILAVAVFVGVKFTAQRTEELPTEPATEVVAAERISESAAVLAHDQTTDDDVIAVAAAQHPTASADTSTDQPEAGTSIVPESVSYALAEAAFFEGRYEEATELFTAYTNQHPQNAWGFYMLGLTFRKCGEPEAAEQALREALTLKPDHLKSLVNLGRVLLDAGRAGEAMPMVEKAVALDPEYVDAYRVLGRIYHNLHQKEEAIQAYRQAILRDDQDVWSLNNLGLIFIESEEFSRALPALARAAQLRDDIPCIQNNLGIALERSGYHQGAAEAYERALAINPDYAKADLSLERTEAREDAPGLAELDLTALAENFSIWPVAVDLAAGAEVSEENEAEAFEEVAAPQAELQQTEQALAELAGPTTAEGSAESFDED